MKEMRLFEVGLKGESYHTGYEEKANIAAKDADEAVAKMRQWVEDKSKRWWESEGIEELTFAAYADDSKASEEMTDKEILATQKYQEAAQKDYENDMERIESLRVAKVLDIGTLIV